MTIKHSILGVGLHISTGHRGKRTAEAAAEAADAPEPAALAAAAAAPAPAAAAALHSIKQSHQESLAQHQR